MSNQEKFVGKVRLAQNKYYDVQIPPSVAEVLKLKKGSLVRVELTVIGPPSAK